MENSLQQYLDLYRDHRELLESKSAEGMNSLREKAYRNLLVTGLPPKGSENYEVSDLDGMLRPDYGLNIARIPLDVSVEEVFKCGLPHLSSSLFFMLNDLFGEARGARNNLPEGVEIGPLSAFMREGGEGVEYYGRLADLANPLVALNTMLCQEGIFIRVRRGVKIERPVQIVNILRNGVPLMAVRRLLIILEEDAELKLVSCDHTSSRSLEMASLGVTEIFAGKNSSLEFYDMEESSALTRRLSSLYLSQERGSDVTLVGITLHNGETRNEFNTVFKDEDSTLRLYGMGIESGERVLDNFSRINHNSPRCNTDELMKYILDDDSRGAFTGRIYVAPGAVKTEAYQSNRNLVGSKRARMFSKPQLEIYNDDVKCSHGSATGQLDATQLFYMRSRGLDAQEAEFLLKQAFMSDVIDGIRLPILRDRVRMLVEKRLSGEDASCDGCSLEMQKE